MEALKLWEEFLLCNLHCVCEKTEHFCMQHIQNLTIKNLPSSSAENP